MTISTLAIRSVRAASEVDINLEQWPFTVPSVRAILRGIDFSPLTVIVGENGAGKSVLVEALAVTYGFPAEGGTSWDQREGIEGQNILAECLELSKGASGGRGGLFFRAEAAYSLVDFRVSAGSDLAKRYLKQSHGESALDMLLAASARGGLWILDEPESGLSFEGQLKLISLIHEHIDAGHQVILCTHSPLLMCIDDARVLEIGPWGVHDAVVDELEVVDHWKRFLDSPERYLRYLRS